MLLHACSQWLSVCWSPLASQVSYLSFSTEHRLVFLLLQVFQSSPSSSHVTCFSSDCSSDHLLFLSAERSRTHMDVLLLIIRVCVSTFARLCTHTCTCWSMSSKSQFSRGRQKQKSDKLSHAGVKPSSTYAIFCFTAVVVHNFGAHATDATQAERPTTRN